MVEKTISPPATKGATMDSSLFHGNLVRSNRIIYTPSAFARTNLIHLQEIGTLKAQKPHTSRRENLPSFLFFLVREGCGDLEYDGVKTHLKAGDCAFLDCKKPYSHRSSEDLWSLQWVHFYGPNMAGIYEKYIERGGRTCFPAASRDKFIDLLNEIFELAGSSDYIRDMKIFEKLTGLLSLLMEESWHPENTAKSVSRRRDLQNMKDYIDLHFSEKLTLDGLAEAFYINKYYLTRVFREQFGITVNSYILQVRITRAKQLLRFSDLSIEKISQECGMNDANYFARMFKKIEGISPGEYRKRW